MNHTRYNDFSQSYYRKDYKKGFNNNYHHMNHYNYNFWNNDYQHDKFKNEFVLDFNSEFNQYPIIDHGSYQRNKKKQINNLSNKNKNSYNSDTFNCQHFRDGFNEKMNYNYWNDNRFNNPNFSHFRRNLYESNNFNYRSFPINHHFSNQVN